MILRSFLSSPVTKRHTERKILQTHPIHLFRIIQDVDAYSKFLPLCSYSKILRKDNDGRSFEATLTVGMPPFFQETYVSRVHVVPERWTVETQSIESKMFDSLRSQWTLSPVDGFENTQCKVDFQVEMTVSDPVIRGALDTVLRQVAERQVDAFEKRCREIPLPHDLLPLQQ
jgi:coenzyme Q-binding protein COQ10